MDGSSVSRRRFLQASAAVGAAADSRASDARGTQGWDREVDVVVVGSGACGLAAAVRAREGGASVIVVEAQPHAGGHAIISGGNILLGGGTSLQRRFGVADSPDVLFRDLTDWSVIEPNGFPDYRYNDREILRAFADHSAPTFEWLVSQGVQFIERAPDGLGGLAAGNSAPRAAHAAAMQWPLISTGSALAAEVGERTSNGIGLIRPLLAAAQRAGVELLLEHRMTALARDLSLTRVTGITVQRPQGSGRIRARRAVLIATGGSTGNVNFRRMFDPRLTEEYSLVGMPWSDQDGSGEIAAMAVGASLWGLYNQVGEFGWNICKAGLIGSQNTYAHLQWLPGSPVFAQARACGLRVDRWEDLILVNMLGQRFYDESGDQFTANDYHSIDPYTAGSVRNVEQIRFNPNNFLNAALAGINDGHNGGGPIWAIFDAATAARHSWHLEAPDVDAAGGYFFSAPSVEELAERIVMPHQRVPMAPAALAASVARFNSFVSAGRDQDFGRRELPFMLSQPPFYAAWATPMVHDTRAGLRINARCQVIDLHGRVIPGLYCGGESAGGFSQHGLARATCQGYIAGSTMLLDSAL